MARAMDSLLLGAFDVCDARNRLRLTGKLALEIVYSRLWMSERKKILALLPELVCVVPIF